MYTVNLYGLWYQCVHSALRGQYSKDGEMWLSPFENLHN